MHEFMNRPWYAVIDDLVGGWAVATIDLPTSQIERRQWAADGEFVVIDLCLDEDVARHVADLHNACLAVTDLDGAAQAAYDALMRLKEVAELNEVQDDAVQDVLDLLWGWCAPSMRIGSGVEDRHVAALHNAQMAASRVEAAARAVLGIIDSAPVVIFDGVDHHDQVTELRAALTAATGHGDP